VRGDRDRASNYQLPTRAAGIEPTSSS
jgi:hypothetical protein